LEKVLISKVYQPTAALFSHTKHTVGVSDVGFGKEYVVSVYFPFPYVFVSYQPTAMGLTPELPARLTPQNITVDWIL
jgi:hypothetical protein